MKTLKKL